jgi:H+/Cl- antiporter ClcA
MRSTTKHPVVIVGAGFGGLKAALEPDGVRRRGLLTAAAGGGGAAGFCPIFRRIRLGTPKAA